MKTDDFTNIAFCKAGVCTIYGCLTVLLKKMTNA